MACPPTSLRILVLLSCALFHTATARAERLGEIQWLRLSQPDGPNPLVVPLGAQLDGLQPKQPSRLVPLLLGGSGLAIAVTGVTFLATTPRVNLTERLCIPDCGMESRAAAGYVLLGAGGAVAAAGVALWVSQRHPIRELRRAWLLPTVGGIAAGGAF